MFRRFEEELLKAPIPEVMFSYYDLRVRQTLKNLKADKLISDFLILFAEAKTLAEHQGGKAVWSEAIEIKRVLFAALIRFLGERKRDRIPIAQWQQEADKLAHLKDEVGQWLDFLQQLLDAPTQILKAVLTDSSANSDRRLLAASLLTAADDIDPETRLYANVLLVHSKYSSQWEDVFADSLASLICQGWERIVEDQLFALQAPRLNAPAIISACRDNSRKGLKKVATILLVASNAVQTRISETIMDELQQLIEQR